jgi:uncharacterized protein (DUF983 family)
MSGKSDNNRDACPHCGTHVGWWRYQFQNTSSCPKCGLKSQLSIKRRAAIGFVCGLFVAFICVPLFKLSFGESHALILAAITMLILVTIALGFLGGPLQPIKK